MINVPRDEDQFMSLFTLHRILILEFDNRIPWGVILELSKEILVVGVFHTLRLSNRLSDGLSGLSDGDLLIACLYLIERVIKIVRIFDLVKGGPNFLRDNKMLFGHD